MRKPITITILALLPIFCGCEEKQNEQSNADCVQIYGSFSTSINILQIKGHEYILVDGLRQGCIIHSESCPCKEKEKSPGKKQTKVPNKGRKSKN